MQWRANRLMHLIRVPHYRYCECNCHAETVLEMRDASQLVAGPKPLHLTLRAIGEEPAHFMLIEMKQQL